jgi:hypothetical protein
VDSGCLHLPSTVAGEHGSLSPGPGRRRDDDGP